MTSRWRRPNSLPALMAAVSLAPAWASAAVESPGTTAALEATDVVTGHLFNALLYLPVGFVVAAMVLEGFAQWKHNRDIEPGILFLLFGAAGAAVLVAAWALAFSPVGRDTGQVNQFAMWMGVVAAFIGVAFYLKRQARNRKLFSISPVPSMSGRMAVPRTSGQKGLIIGYRMVLGAAFMVALLGVSEMPLSHAETRSVATAVRGVLNPSAASSGGPVQTPPESAPPAAPAPEKAGPPKLADLIGKREPAVPDPAKSLATTVNAAIEGSLPVSPAAAPPRVPPVPAPTPSPETVASTPGSAAPTTTPPEPPAEGAMAPKSPSPAPAAAPKPVVAKGPAAVPKLEKNFFAAKVKPILDSKCVNCHGSSKQKGDLRLDGAAMVKHGVKGRAIAIAGDLELSSLYQRLISTDDEDAMPPKDKGGPLPPAMIAVVKAWIEAGADYGDGPAPGAAVVAPPPSRPGGKFEEELSKTLPPADAATVARLNKGGAVIRPMSANGALLDINLSHYEAGPVSLPDLAPLAKNIYVLDLTKARLKDDDLAALAAMPHLTRLELKRNSIGDAGLQHLRGLTNLESLNLYETQVTDAGLDQLAGLKKLKKLFLFNTKCTPAGADKLKGQLPGIAINLGE